MFAAHRQGRLTRATWARPNLAHQLWTSSDETSGGRTDHRGHYRGVRADGQFNITGSSDKPVRPIPYPSSRTREEWDVFLNELFQRWGGQLGESDTCQLTGGGLGEVT